MNEKVDHYLSDGCGRCSLGGTPECKVHLWENELVLLRTYLLDSGLTEELKWGVPCYTYKNSNILILAAFKEYCSISFFKGALLQDTNQILSQPGEHTQSARLIKFTDVKQIRKLEPTIKAYIYEAIEVEKAGLKVAFKKPEEFQIIEEFQTKLDQFPALKIAFDALTPGRQRGYLLHFSAPKQAKTRESRIEQCIPQILSGKGMND
ncbi:MAG: YdeI/OmpD-associated family protein [Bacteroidetes bacterium]|nr:YdeI/OmpD-associated family protein [Bacteroidota bacterium]